MSENKLRPLFLVKPGTVSRKDIRRAQEQCGVCIIECAEPEQSRYSEAPLGANLDEQARAALSLFRLIVNNGTSQSTFYKGDLLKWFVDALINQRPPQEVPKTPAVKR